TLLDKPEDILFRKKIAFTIGFERKALSEPKICSRSQQQLENERRSSSISRQVRNYRRQISSGTHPTQRNSGRVAIKAACMVRSPACRCVTVFQASRKFIFGGQMVIDRNHQCTRQICQAPAMRIFRVEIPHNPPTTVEI